MTEHLVAIVSFEGAVKREIKRLREQLKSLETVPQFEFTIRAEGRLHDGEVQLSYKLDSYSLTGSGVSGYSLQPVVDEFMRRLGWEKVNAPKALAYEKIPGEDTNPETPPAPQPEDEMPF